jgi:hypothetical protein
MVRVGGIGTGLIAQEQAMAIAMTPRMKLRKHRTMSA